MRHDTKTCEQLQNEIRYYAWVLTHTNSPDRQRRAHIAVQTREAALQVVRAREAQIAQRTA